MPFLPAGFHERADRIVEVAQRIEGHLSEREIRFLWLLGAVPTTAGGMLEIGTFMGKSTVVIASAADLAGGGTLDAVDPLTCPSITDHDTNDPELGRRQLERTLREHGVTNAVRFHQMLSAELGRNWNRTLRLLWIDGDHTYEGVSSDYATFSPYLASGAILAFHDVLHPSEGPLRVVVEEVLGDERFGACGACGSIVWAQFLGDPGEARPYAAPREELRRRLERLVGDTAPDGRVRGFKRQRFKLNRARVPHGPVDPEAWLRTVRFVSS